MSRFGTGAAVVIAVVVTVGATGCGDSSTSGDTTARDNPDVAAAVAQATDRAKTAAPSSGADPWANSESWPKPDFSDPPVDNQHIQIAEVITDVQRDFPAKVGSGVCHELTPAGRREIVETGIGVYDTCETIVPEIVRRMRLERIGPRFSKILHVSIDGDRATALIQDRGDNTQPYGIPLVKLPVEGWKLPSLTLLEPVDWERLSGLKPDSIDPRVRDDKTAITEVLADVQSDFAAGFGFNVCSELVEREQVRLGRLGIARRGDCGEAVDEIERRMRKQSIERWSSRIVSITIAGSTEAIAKVRDRHRPDGAPRPVRFFKEKLRGWRLVDLSEAEPLDRVLAK